jgi:SAM-dependent methyltransferase
MQCRICGNDKGNRLFKFREMHIGLREEFTYFQCVNCRCIQIEEIPENMSKYYPSDYYSFNLSPISENVVKRAVRRQRDYYALFNKGFIGGFVRRRFPSGAQRSRSLYRVSSLTKDSRILDVGCGNGYFIRELKDFGFKYLVGIDPYVRKGTDSGDHVKILKKSIHQLSGKYDLIMFHHSFEHIPDPRDTLLAVGHLLSSDGTCLIRIPVVDSWAWKNYKENWVLIDAPRHFFLHSYASMQILAEHTGFKIREVVCDSGLNQFYGSEQYKRDIPLVADNSYKVNPSKSIFSKKEIRLFKEKAKQLNSIGQGDQAAFYLEKIHS